MAKYKHITTRRLWELKEQFIQQKMQDGKLGAELIGSSWIGDFIIYVSKNKNT